MHRRFLEYFTRKKKLLQAKQDVSGILDSPTDRGNVREQFCSFFLQDFLPEEVSIVSGEVVDSFDRSMRADQLDIVLYDPKTMTLTVQQDIKVLPVEGCLAAIEVKSTLNKRHFFLALDKCRKFKDLELSLTPLLPTADIGYTLVDPSVYEEAETWARVWRPNIETFVKPKFYVFAYTGPADLRTVRRWVAEYADEHYQDFHQFTSHFPDLVCILDLGVVYRNDGFAFELQPLVGGVTEHGIVPNDPVFVPNTEYEMVAFALHVLEAARLTQKNNRLQAMGLSLSLKPYFSMEILPDAEW